MSRKIILGIDTGLAITGWATIELKDKRELEVQNYGYIKTEPENNLSERLLYIYTQLKKIVNKYKPDIICIEEIYYPLNNGVPRYSKSIINTSQARGIVLLIAAQKNITVKEFNAKTVKLSVTGYGGATKYQVHGMIQKLLYLKNLPKLDDISDALALAYVGSAYVC